MDDTLFKLIVIAMLFKTYKLLEIHEDKAISTTPAWPPRWFMQGFMRNLDWVVMLLLFTGSFVLLNNLATDINGEQPKSRDAPVIRGDRGAE